MVARSVVLLRLKHVLGLGDLFRHILGRGRNSTRITVDGDRAPWSESAMSRVLVSVVGTVVVGTNAVDVVVSGSLIVVSGSQSWSPVSVSVSVVGTNCVVVSVMVVGTSFVT